MSAFTDTQPLARWGMEVVRRCCGAFPGKPREVAPDIESQLAHGDWVVTAESGVECGLEVKTRAKDWGDELLEVWSDEHVRAGWLWTSHADFLVNVYRASGRACVVPFEALQEWALHAIDAYPYRVQTQREQRNRTAFRVVPTAVLVAESRAVACATFQDLEAELARIAASWGAALR